MQINVLEYFEKTLKKFSDKIAIVDRDREITFSDLNIISESVCNKISEKKSILNKPIAVFLPKCVEVIILDIGILKSGNVYTNIDVKLPLQRIINIFKNIEPELVFSLRKFDNILIDAGILPQKIFFIDNIINEKRITYNISKNKKYKNLIDSDPACIVNTSGSTGTPKAVVMNHHSIIGYIDWLNEKMKLSHNEIIGSLAPFYFDIYTIELFVCLSTGATMVIIPEKISMFPLKLMEYVIDSKVNFVIWVPSIMINISNFGVLERIDLSNFKKIIFAGEVFPTKHFNKWRNYCQNAIFMNIYGPTEITVNCTYYIVEREFNDNEPIPIGFPCRNRDIMILTDEDKNANTYEQGELCVRSSLNSMGYWNEAGITKKAYTQNPLNNKYPELIFRTGDLVYKNDLGEIIFVGRKDFQIKHMGFRIELPEIEHHILNLDEIKNACVLYNKNNKEITLFYESETEIDNKFIISTLGKILPDYMLPNKIYFLNKLPLNPNGKIDRKYLTDNYLC